jgi:hypothetical protein
MGDFDWKIWLFKGVKEAGIVAIAAFVTALANYIEITNLPAEYIAYGGFAVLLLNQIANYVKHTYLVD